MRVCDWARRKNVGVATLLSGQNRVQEEKGRCVCYWVKNERGTPPKNRAGVGSRRVYTPRDF